MFLLHRKRAYESPRPVTVIALLYFYFSIPQTIEMVAILVSQTIWQADIIVLRGFRLNYWSLSRHGSFLD
jgi:hypothetical protein